MHKNQLSLNKKLNNSFDSTDSFGFHNCNYYGINFQVSKINRIHSHSRVCNFVEEVISSRKSVSLETGTPDSKYLDQYFHQYIGSVA